jgi:hypothetical protein
MQAGVSRAKMVSGLLGDTDIFAGAKSPMTSMKTALGQKSFYDAPISFGEPYGTWGKYIDPEQPFQQMLRSGRGEASWGKMIAHEAGLSDIGIGDPAFARGAGTLATKISGLMVRGAGAAGVKGQLFRGVGKMLPAASRVGGLAFAAYDVYNIGLFAGSMLGKAGLAMMKAPVKRYENMTSDIHRGTFMTSSPLSPFVGATSRQRAIADVYDRNLNLRQVLGNEAGYLANLGY